MEHMLGVIMTTDQQGAKLQRLSIKCCFTVDCKLCQVATEEKGQAEQLLQLLQMCTHKFHASAVNIPHIPSTFSVRLSGWSFHAIAPAHHESAK